MIHLRQFVGATPKILILLASALLFGSCINPWSFWFPPDVPHQMEGDRIVYYIAPGGDDKAQGDAGAPMGSLQAAFNRIRTVWRDDDLGQRFLFRVKPGTYTPGRGLVSEGKYGALLSTRIHNDGGFIMNIRIEFLGTSENPGILDGQGRVESVFVFQAGQTDYRLAGTFFSPAVPGQIADGSTNEETVSLPGGYVLEISGLDNLTILP